MFNLSAFQPSRLYEFAWMGNQHTAGVIWRTLTVFDIIEKPLFSPVHVSTMKQDASANVTCAGRVLTGLCWLDKPKYFKTFTDCHVANVIRCRSAVALRAHLRLEFSNYRIWRQVWTMEVIVMQVCTSVAEA